MLHFPRLIKVTASGSTQKRHEWNFIADCGKGKQKKAKTIIILEQESEPFCVRTCRSSHIYTQRPPPGISTGLGSGPALVSKGAVSHCDQQPVSSRKSPHPTIPTPLPSFTPALCVCLVKAKSIFIPGILLLSSLLSGSKSPISAWIEVR